MPLTPSNSRMMNSSTWTLRLTPSSSPFAKNQAAKSPIKTSRQQDFSLSLKQVIGTTTTSASGFDSLPSTRSFAFTAGAAAVIATVDESQQVTQRFFRARPTAAPLNPTTSIYGPSTPTSGGAELRSRSTASLQNAGIGISPFGSPAGDWVDSPGNKSWTSRERVKAATCVSFSPDGRYLAVGETGYKPRVLIFSTSKDAPPDIPLTSLSDHHFGVRCVAFSPDAQYLASLGCTNDGYVYVWSINPKNGSAILHASNKCTSSISKMAWLGNALVTVGTRHVKVWRADDSSLASPARSRFSDVNPILSSLTNRTLPGRNCLLGSLLEATFTGVVAVTPSKAIVSSDKGDICLLDDSEGTQRFLKIANAGFGITAMSADSHGRLHLAGSQGGLITMKIDDILNIQTPPPSPAPTVESSVVNLMSECYIHAMATLGDYLVTIDSLQVIHLIDLPPAHVTSLSESAARKLPAHADGVLGVSALNAPNHLRSSFYTWSTSGTVLFWSQDGTCKGEMQVPLDQFDCDFEDINELRVVRASSHLDFIVTGDKFGVLRVIHGETKEILYDTKAHAGEITDISIHEGKATYIASSGRDRHVQVFQRRPDGWDLLQTLDEHVGAVTGVAFSDSGHRLLSCSSDRTVVVREAVTRDADTDSRTAFLILRTITLKASPLSMAFDSDQDDALILSTIDRYVHKYDLRSGHVVTSFKSSDAEGGDAVALSSLVHVPTYRGSAIVAGVSSTDKSVRLYEETGFLICRDWGHTEGITDIALVTPKGQKDESEQAFLVTVAVDGTIFIWSMETRLSSRNDLSKSMDLLTSTPTGKDLLANKPPLRRVLSQSELARFQKQFDDDSAAPGGSKSPRLRKRGSKFTLAQAPKLEPSPILPSIRGNFQTPGQAQAEAASRKGLRNRSPSPPSPRNPQLGKFRRPSMEARSRAKNPAAASEFGSLANSTEQVCRTLRAYRKKLAISSDALSSDTVRELERELGLTARSVGEKAIKSKGVDEVMLKLLDQYSEKLVEMLDEKIAASVARQVRQNGESGGSSGMPGGQDGGEGDNEETGPNGVYAAPEA